MHNGQRSICSSDDMRQAGPELRLVKPSRKTPTCTMRADTLEAITSQTVATILIKTLLKGVCVSKRHVKDDDLPPYDNSRLTESYSNQICHDDIEFGVNTHTVTTHIWVVSKLAGILI